MGLQSFVVHHRRIIFGLLVCLCFISILFSSSYMGLIAGSSWAPATERLVANASMPVKEERNINVVGVVGERKKEKVDTVNQTIAQQNGVMGTKKGKVDTVNQTIAQQNVVMGIGFGVQLFDHSTFIKSFRRFNKKDRLVVFIDAASYKANHQNDPSALIAYTTKWRVQVVVINHSNTTVPDALAKPVVLNLDLSNPNNTVPYDPAMIKSARYDVARFFFYASFLHRFHAALNMAILSDLRDVVFMNDPFEQMTHKKEVSFYLEAPASGNIGSNPYNSNWIRTCFGETVLSGMRQKLISCSGITSGPANLVLQYAMTMCDIMFTFPPTAYAPGCRTSVKGADQGAHNYLIHWHSRQVTNLFPFRVVENDVGLAYTVGYVNTDDLTWKKENHVEAGFLNANGVVPSMMHQYDRHGDVWNKIQKWYEDM